MKDQPCIIFIKKMLLPGFCNAAEALGNPCMSVKLGSQSLLPNTRLNCSFGKQNTKQLKDMFLISVKVEHVSSP